MAIDCPATTACGRPPRVVARDDTQPLGREPGRALEALAGEHGAKLARREQRPPRDRVAVVDHDTARGGEHLDAAPSPERTVDDTSPTSSDPSSW